MNSRPRAKVSMTTEYLLPLIGLDPKQYDVGTVEFNPTRGILSIYLHGEAVEQWLDEEVAEGSECEELDVWTIVDYPDYEKIPYNELR